jgi:hypothetical protein
MPSCTRTRSRSERSAALSLLRRRLPAEGYTGNPVVQEVLILRAFSKSF